MYTLQASEKQRQKCKSILDWIKLLTATLKQKPFQFEISVQSVPSSWNGINESILSSSSQANTQVTSLHLLIVGHKANKLVCECRGNSTVPHQTVHMLLGLAATVTIDLELYNYQTVFCSPCPCLSVLPTTVRICVYFGETCTAQSL